MVDPHLPPGPYDIFGYVSPYPGSMQWVVSGEPSAVDALQAEVMGVEGTRVVARADDGAIAFARFDLPASLPFRIVGSLVFNAQSRRLLIGSPLPNPLYPTGCAEAIGDPTARQPIVGILGSPEALETARGSISWAETFPIWLLDDREGLAFRPTIDQLDDYRRFIASAVSGAFQTAEVVLLQKLM